MAASFLLLLALSISSSLQEEVPATAIAAAVTTAAPPGTSFEDSNVVTSSDKFRDMEDDADEQQQHDREEDAEDGKGSSGSSSTSNRLEPLIIKANPIISSLPTQLLGSTLVSESPKAGVVNGATKRPSTAAGSYNFQYGDFPPGSSTANVKSHLDQLFSKVPTFPQLTFVTSPAPNNGAFVQGVQYIKDAYFELLESMREFRVNMIKRMDAVEEQVRDLAGRMNDTSLTLPITLPDTIAQQLDNMISQSWFLRMRELERVFNMSRMVDHCAHYIVGNHLEEALGIWTVLEELTKGNKDQANRNLLDIIKLAYARNSTNSSPAFRFLRRLQGVDKIPVYDILVSGMKTKENFEGSEIFYIAQYLKERNAVRSSVYSKIPRVVQYAVSGRNINIVFVGKEHGRNYIHVRDDQTSGERANFYIQASQSYTDTRSAVWNFIFQSSTETFHIRNSLFGDYMFVNGEGFLETLLANAPVLPPGAEFTFVLENNSVVIHSNGQPLVVLRGGGRFPYYFSLQSENPHAPPAQFLVEPDTLL